MVVLNTTVLHAPHVCMYLMHFVVFCIVSNVEHRVVAEQQLRDVGVSIRLGNRIVKWSEAVNISAGGKGAQIQQHLNVFMRWQQSGFMDWCNTLSTKCVSYMCQINTLTVSFGCPK